MTKYTLPITTKSREVILITPMMLSYYGVIYSGLVLELIA